MSATEGPLVDPKSTIAGNSLQYDEKPVPVTYIPRVQDDNSEYSDPEISYEEEEYDVSEEDPTLNLPDIDQRNIDMPFYAPLIAEKIVKNNQAREEKLQLSTEIFQKVQPNLTEKHHELALIWIFRAFALFKLKEDESLYQAIYMLNQVLCRREISFDQLQLYSVVCIWISCKVEENIHIPLASLCMICSNQITEQQIKETEPIVVTTLDCDLNPVTPLFYIQRFLNAIDAEENLSNLAYFFMDIALVYHEFLNYSPTIIAVASVCAAKISSHEFCPIKRLLGYAHLDDEDISNIRKCGIDIFTRAQVLCQQPGATIVARFRGDFALLSQIDLDLNLFNSL